MATVDVSTEPASPGRGTPSRLGEELPIFCDKCGYALHGLEQTLCTQCGLRHFACPECGAHQQLNSWRPALMRLVGRLRMVGLALVVLAKVAVFAFLGFLWLMFLGDETYRYFRSGEGRQGHFHSDLNGAGILIVVLFAVISGALFRLLLLRYRSGVVVGAAIATYIAVLAGLVMWLNAASYYRDDDVVRHAYIIWSAMIVCFGVGWGLRRLALKRQSAGVNLLAVAAIAGGWAVGIWQWTLGYYHGVSQFIFVMLMIMTGCMIGATIAWPIWCALTSAFLPSWASRKLLAWQRSLSDPAMPVSTGTELANDPVDAYAKRI